ncbi:MAG TPA: IclR family transcriptional regulator [Kineosporiaceae bacterium]|nr:IclR family transcriptional regulator [Kineosporiaceae bacterium]
MPRRKDDRSPSRRSLDILDAFSEAQPVLTLSQIARISDLPLPTAHRLVAELLAWGALERDDSGALQIGLHLWEIAALAPRALGLREIAMPFIEDLYEATHQNVSLGARDGSEVLYLERVSGREAVGILAKVGSRWPLHATGVGLVLLAYAPIEIQERILAAPLQRFTPKTIGDPGELRATLAEIRRTGVAISDRQITLDAISVAAPIHDRTGRVIAAISLVLPSAETSQGQYVPLVRTSARGISRALGWGFPSSNRS